MYDKGSCGLVPVVQKFRKGMFDFNPPKLYFGLKSNHYQDQTHPRNAYQYSINPSNLEPLLKNKKNKEYVPLDSEFEAKIGVFGKLKIRPKNSPSSVTTFSRSEVKMLMSYVLQSNE
jgi:hypothetical protein